MQGCASAVVHTLHVSMIVGRVGKRAMVQLGWCLALIRLLDMHPMPDLRYHT